MSQKEINNFTEKDLVFISVPINTPKKLINSSLKLEHMNIFDPLLNQEFVPLHNSVHQVLSIIGSNCSYKNSPDGIIRSINSLNHFLSFYNKDPDKDEQIKFHLSILYVMCVKNQENLNCFKLQNGVEYLKKWILKLSPVRSDSVLGAFVKLVLAEKKLRKEFKYCGGLTILRKMDPKNYKNMN